MRIFTLLLILFFSVSSFASDLERAHLKDLANTLEHHRKLIDSARNAADKGAYSVDYGKLERDYNALISGIREIVNLPRREPRVIVSEDQRASITGDYVSVQ